MKTTYVITTFSKENYLEYANKTISSWKDNWPNGWKLVTVDSEIDIQEDIKLSCPEKKSWINFVKKNLSTPHLPRGHQRYWEKFCHKSWAQFTAYENLKSGYVIWCDADVLFLETPPSNLVEKELNGFFSGYLGRDNHPDKRHSSPETGIIFYDLDHVYSNRHFSKLKEIYSGLNLFENSGWSDEVIYGLLRDINPSVYKSMSPTHDRYPLYHSYLSKYFNHYMGHHAKKQLKN